MAAKASSEAKVLKRVIGAVLDCEEDDACDCCWARLRSPGITLTQCALVQALAGCVREIPVETSHVRIGNKSIKVR
jgi:hypothetical protein